MIRKLLVVFGLLLVLLLPAPVAASGDIKLTASSTKIDFPSALTFNIKAESSAPITRIRLRYEIEKSTYAPAYAEAWPDFTPSKSVSTSWTWDMRTTLTPPGAKITYWWVIEDSSGNKITTPKEKVGFDDNRYKWQKVSSRMVNLYWYKGNSTFAQDLLNAANAAVDKLGKDTGAPLEVPAEIYIYANENDLQGSMVATEEWTGGVKYMEFNVISIGISAGNLDWGKKAIAHELGHEVTHQLLTSPYSAYLPLWLDEGMAMHAEGAQDDNARNALIKAVKDGSIATLKSLSGPFPADPNDAAYAYAQSQSVVEYLLDKYGNTKMHDLLVYFNDGHTIDEALTKVYGFDTAGLDGAWKLYMAPVKSNGSAMEKGAAPLSITRIPSLAYGS
jgi:hypothetical protein